MAVERLAALDEIGAEIWRQLVRAPHDKHHAWRTPVLATVSDDGADARTVVLREVLAERQQLVVYTDRRAAKVAQAMSHPTGTLVMWSKTLGWQLRCKLQFALVPEADNAARWARLRESPAAADYLSPLAPGAVLGESTPMWMSPPPANAHHFAALVGQVIAIDWLELHRDGHRRARFDSAGARWLQA